MVWLHGFDGSVQRFADLDPCYGYSHGSESQNRFYYILTRRLKHESSTIKLPFIDGLMSPSCISSIRPSFGWSPPSPKDMVSPNDMHIGSDEVGMRIPALAYAV
jgi:hypothetical protein